ncbi:MAG TPA: chemotaxis protein CheX [Fibrobacteres bacterium]|nr:chemotaxis protein CheX [Fibrobacterota bacterium]
MKMNVAYVNPFISATMNMFKTMLNTDLKPGTPTIKKELLPAYDISGVIGLSGEAQGSIALSFPKIVALKIVSALIGTEIKIVGPELTDGIGELANIIAGNAKQDLSQFHLSISLPNVIIGKDHVIASPSGTPTIIVPFSCVFGNFAMEMSLKTK